MDQLKSDQQATARHLNTLYIMYSLTTPPIYTHFALLHIKQITSDAADTHTHYNLNVSSNHTEHLLSFLF